MTTTPAPRQPERKASPAGDETAASAAAAESPGSPDRLFSDDVADEDASGSVTGRSGGRTRGGRGGAMQPAGAGTPAGATGRAEVQRAMAEGRIVRVVPERGMDQVPEGLTYWVPKALGPLQVGERVDVPLGRGNRPTAGFVVSVGVGVGAGDSTVDPRRLKPVLRRDQDAPRLTPQLLELGRWMASYYCTPIGTVLGAMIPAAVKHGTGRVDRRMVRLTEAGRAALATGRLPLPPEARESSPPDRRETDVGGAGDTDTSDSNTVAAPPAAKAPAKGRRLTALQKAVLDAARGEPEPEAGADAGPDAGPGAGADAGAGELVGANDSADAADGAFEGDRDETALSQSPASWELERGQAASPAFDLRELADRAGARSTAPVVRLIDLGLLEEERRSTVHAVWDQFEIEPPARVTPTPPQQRIIEAIATSIDAGGFGVDAIYGVTGSGKTEVYLCLIERIVAAGRRAIMLVPEIALTPQTAERFRARFGDGVAILHSGLTAAQRHQQWTRVRQGEAKVVVGARSAVFAPIADGDLGLIVVDEEHDSSYKQDQAPRYQARDVAIKRAHLAGVRVVLGSATPALETYVNARTKPGWRWFELRERVPGTRLPQVRIVNLAEEWRKAPREDRRVHLLGPTLEGALERTLAAGGQAMLLLNRRGYANYIACPDQGCGFVLCCTHCDAAMVFHKERSLPRGGFVRCHHCEAEQMLPEKCPQCRTRQIMTFGLGTQRLEEELERKFEGVLRRGATLLRMDSDTMQSGRHYHDALAAFRRGEIRVLLGTQMIAKGLDFPNVRLVGVINADTSINLPDFRSGERTFQLVSQVAGRSGRGQDAGLVVVQTFQPDLMAIQAAARHDYYGFANRELQDREAAGLPPLGRMARIVVRDLDHDKCAGRAAEIAWRLRVLAGILPAERPPAVALSGPGAGPGGGLAVNEMVARMMARLPEREVGEGGVRVRGPAPCPLSRLHDHFRQSIEIFAPSAGPILRLLGTIRSEGLAVSDAATAIDMDPVSLL